MLNKFLTAILAAVLAACSADYDYGNPVLYLQGGTPTAEATMSPPVGDGSVVATGGKLCVAVDELTGRKGPKEHFKAALSAALKDRGILADFTCGFNNIDLQVETVLIGGASPEEVRRVSATYGRPESLASERRFQKPAADPLVSAVNPALAWGVWGIRRGAAEDEDWKSHHIGVFDVDVGKEKFRLVIVVPPRKEDWGAIVLAKAARTIAGLYKKRNP